MFTHYNEDQFLSRPLSTSQAISSEPNDNCRGLLRPAEINLSDVLYVLLYLVVAALAAIMFADTRSILGLSHWQRVCINNGPASRLFAARRSRRDNEMCQLVNFTFIHVAHKLHHQSIPPRTKSLIAQLLIILKRCHVSWLLSQAIWLSIVRERRFETSQPIIQRQKNDENIEIELNLELSRIFKWWHQIAASRSHLIALFDHASARSSVNSPLSRIRGRKLCTRNGRKKGDF